MPNPGVDVYVVDEVISGAEARETHTLYILSPNGPATPTKKTAADTGNAALDNALRAYFIEGGTSVYIMGYGDGSTLPLPADAVAALPGLPGQIVAPEAVTSADIIAIANAAWGANKVYLYNGPTNAAIAALVTLRAAVTAGATAGARGAAMFAGVGTYPGATAGAANVDVPWPIAVAGMISRNDRLLLNPNLAAAGVRGISRALGIKQVAAVGDKYTTAEITTLKNAQINAAKIVGPQIRNYGFRTSANLDALPHWWDLSGSRTIMALRALAAGLDEDFLFDQIDGNRLLLDRYEGTLRDACRSLWARGALYGNSPADAYSVDTGETVNPIQSIAAGGITANIRVRTSPYAEHVITNIIRRALTAQEL